MAIYTILGDPHITEDNLDKADKLYSMIEDAGNPVIELGDTLHTKSIINGPCINFLFNKLKSSKLHWYILIGNHTWFNAECTQHSLEVLKELPNVTVVDKVITYDTIVMAPYYNDLAKFRLDVLSIKDQENKILVMHQGVNGFDYGNGFLAEKELNLEELRGFKRVISGHFHKTQLKGNLFYPGTPFSHSFGESNQVKCISIYDTVTDEIGLVNTGLPQHMTTEINCDNPEELIAVHTFNSSNYNRVILSGSQQNISKFDKKLYSQVKFVEKPTIETNSTNLRENDTPATSFLRWAKDIKNLDKDTTDLGLSIIKEVL